MDTKDIAGRYCQVYWSTNVALNTLQRAKSNSSHVLVLLSPRLPRHHHPFETGARCLRAHKRHIETHMFGAPCAATRAFLVLYTKCKVIRHLWTSPDRSCGAKTSDTSQDDRFCDRRQDGIRLEQTLHKTLEYAPLMQPYATFARAKVAPALLVRVNLNADLHRLYGDCCSYPTGSRGASLL